MATTILFIWSYGLLASSLYERIYYATHAHAVHDTAAISSSNATWQVAERPQTQTSWPVWRRLRSIRNQPANMHVHPYT